VGKAESEGSRAEAEANDLGGRSQKDCSRSACKVGEDKAGSLKEPTESLW